MKNCKRVLINILVFFSVTVFLCGCKPVRELKNMQKCDFEFVSVSDFEYAGVHFNEIRSIDDIGLENITKIIAATASQTAKVSFNINIKVLNKSNSRASINGAKWILYMEDQQLLEGNMSNHFSVEPHNSNVMMLRASILPSLRGRAAPLQQIFRLYQSIMGLGEDSPPLTLKIKPILNKTELPYMVLKLN